MEIFLILCVLRKQNVELMRLLKMVFLFLKMTGYSRSIGIFGNAYLFSGAPCLYLIARLFECEVLVVFNYVLVGFCMVVFNGKCMLKV